MNKRLVLVALIIIAVISSNDLLSMDQKAKDRRRRKDKAIIGLTVSALCILYEYGKPRWSKWD